MRRDLLFITRPLKAVCLAAWADKKTLKTVLFLGLVQMLGALAGCLLFPYGQAYIHGPIFDKLLAWDARYYLAIGQHGYTWNKAYCTVHFCSLAFFPLQGLIDRVFLFLFSPLGARVAIFLSSWAFGAASIFCFARLARCVMRQGADKAVFLYALCPGTVFFAMGYPTGLMLLLIILALHNALEQKWWRSACLIGIGSAAGSAVVFAGAGIGIYYLVEQVRQRITLRACLNILGWAGLSLSGLLLFIAYQYLALGDATGFVTAQLPWSGVASFSTKIARLGTVYWHVAYLLETLDWYHTAFHSLLRQNGNEIVMLQHVGLHIDDFIEMVVQAFFNLSFYVLAWIGLALCVFFVVGRKAKILLCGSGLCVLLGYEWFILATEWNMEATIRLLSPSVALFIGLGGACHKVKLVEYTLFSLFTAVSILQMALVVSGFSVM